MIISYLRRTEIIIKPIKLGYTENELFCLSKKLHKKKLNHKYLLMSGVYQCCGKGDFLYKGNVRFKKHFKRLRFDYTFSDKKGVDHNWGYWNKSIKKFSKFITKSL